VLRQAKLCLIRKMLLYARLELIYVNSLLECLKIFFGLRKMVQPYTVLLCTYLHSNVRSSKPYLHT
jgi:hypothetical protein